MSYLEVITANLPKDLADHKSIVFDAQVTALRSSAARATALNIRTQLTAMVNTVYGDNTPSAPILNVRGLFPGAPVKEMFASAVKDDPKLTAMIHIGSLPAMHA